MSYKIDKVLYASIDCVITRYNKSLVRESPNTPWFLKVIFQNDNKLFSL